MDAQSLRADIERAAREIDYSSREWRAIEKVLRAQRWLYADTLLTDQTDVQAATNRGRAAHCSELLKLREQYGAARQD